VDTTLIEFKEWLLDLVQLGRFDNFSDKTLADLIVRSAELYRSIHHRLSAPVTHVRQALNLLSVGFQDAALLPSPCQDFSFVASSNQDLNLLRAIRQVVTKLPAAGRDAAQLAIPDHFVRNGLAPSPFALLESKGQQFPFKRGIGNADSSEDDNTIFKRQKRSNAEVGLVAKHGFQSSLEKQTRLNADAGIEADHDGHASSVRQKCSHADAGPEAGHDLPNGARHNSKDLNQLLDALPAASHRPVQIAKTDRPLPTITIQYSVAPQDNRTQIPVLSLQAAILDNIKVDPRSLFIVWPNLSCGGKQPFNARDIIDGLQHASRPSGSGSRHLPMPVEIQEILFGFKLTWPTPFEVSLVRDVPIVVRGVENTFQSFSSSKVNATLSLAPGHGTEQGAIAVLAGLYGAGQFSLGRCQFPGMKIDRYWVRMLQFPKMRSTERINSGPNNHISQFRLTRIDICNVCGRSLKRSHVHCYILPMMHRDFCSSFL
jgi:hypothetical protein